MMSAENPPLPKPRGHDSLSRPNGLPNQKPPSMSPAAQRDRDNSDGARATEAHTEGFHQTIPPGRRLVRGIRDEPAPPVLITPRNVSGTLGMPECVRRAAFDERLYRLTGYLPLDESLDLLSDKTSLILETEENCFASSEYEPSDCSTSSSKTSDPPPINVEEASRLCHSLRAKALYRRNHPSEEKQSSDDEEDSDEYSDCDLAASDTFDTPQQVSEYENVRWTLARPPPSPTTAAENASTAEPSALALKYGLSGSLLLAKQRFCMEAPEPIRIDSRAFRASKNKERTEETILLDCSESVECLLGLVPTCVPPTNSCSLDEVVEFHAPIIRVAVGSQVCSPSSNLGVALHHKPLEMRISSLSMASLKPDSESPLAHNGGDLSGNVVTAGCEIGPVTSHESEEAPERTSLMSSKASCVAFDRIASDASTEASKTTMNTLEESVVAQCKSSTYVSEGAVMCVQNADALNPLAMCEFDGEVQSKSRSPEEIDASAARSECTMTTSSSEEEEEESDEIVFLRRPVVVPPVELGTQLRENIEAATRQTRVPLYILTSQLDSDGDEHPADPQDELDDEEDTTDSSSSEALTPVSELHRKQIAALKARLSQLEKEMLDLEAQGVEKERTLRQLEETVGENMEAQMSHLSTSEPDLSGKGTKSHSFSTKRKNNPRWWWVRPRRLPHKQSHAAQPSKLGVEMAECPERVQVFTELLSIISERNKLVTQEAIIMAELKKIELEAYEETLQMAYDSVQRPGAEAHQQGKSNKIPFRLPRGGRSRKSAMCSAPREPTQEHGEERLRDEIWRVSKERVALTVVQGETIERSNLQELSVRQALSRDKDALHRALSTHHRADPDDHDH